MRALSQPAAAIRGHKVTQNEHAGLPIRRNSGIAQAPALWRVVRRYGIQYVNSRSHWRHLRVLIPAKQERRLGILADTILPDSLTIP